MRRSNLALFLYLSLVFTSGVVVGVVGSHFYTVRSSREPHHHWSPEEYRRHYVAFMKKRLHLTPQQLRQLNAILDATRERFETLEKQTIRPRKRAIFAAQVKAFEAILTPAQRAEYEKLRREHAAARKKHATRNRANRSSGREGEH